MPPQAYAKAINPRVQDGRFSLHTTMPSLLAHAVKTYGWRFIPDQVLPPLLANITVGAVLYTSYLQILGALYEPSSQPTKTVFSPPAPTATFTAGLAAGGLQSLVAAPLDALQARFDTRDRYCENKTMWGYGKGKLQDIGVRGIFAGWGLSLLKDSFGSGIFFATFEYVKAQCYYSFIRTYYGSLEPWTVTLLAKRRGTGNAEQHKIPTIKPHYALEPAFLMLAGVAASVAQQGIIYPLSKVQTVHYERLEAVDEQAAKLQRKSQKGKMLEAYYRAYQETWNQCRLQAMHNGSLRHWFFSGFWWNTIKQVPSTSAGLVIFELVRRKYGLGEEVRISADGYDILLT